MGKFFFLLFFFINFGFMNLSFANSQWRSVVKCEDKGLSNRAFHFYQNNDSGEFQVLIKNKEFISYLEEILPSSLLTLYTKNEFVHFFATPENSYQGNFTIQLGIVGPNVYYLEGEKIFGDSYKIEVSKSNFYSGMDSYYRERMTGWMFHNCQ